MVAFKLNYFTFKNTKPNNNRRNSNPKKVNQVKKMIKINTSIKNRSHFFPLLVESKPLCQRSRNHQSKKRNFKKNIVTKVGDRGHFLAI